MKPGTQIAYIPSHANGCIDHPDVEFGFVTSEHKDGNAHFCRYWHKGQIGVQTLRTLANSELTPNENLVEYQFLAQGFIDGCIEAIKQGIL